MVTIRMLGGWRCFIDKPSKNRTSVPFDLRAEPLTERRKRAQVPVFPAIAAPGNALRPRRRIARALSPTCQRVALQRCSAER
jgi:hypothetical protein